MDQRGKKIGATSSSRGRGTRSNPVRPIQTQSAPRPKQPFSAPRQQPHSTLQQYYYRPQPPSPPRQNLDYPPLNPNDYHVYETANFNPFDTYREQPEGSEDEFLEVPETQMNFDDDNDDVQEVQEHDVPKKKFVKRAEKKGWTTEEEEALAKAWVHISTCRTVGMEQGRDSFWKRILAHFATNVKDTTRSHHSLTTKWREMNGLISMFNGLYHQSRRLWESCCSELDILTNAMESFKKKQDKPFNHLRAWEIVKGEAKWLEKKCVQDEETSHSDKRRKSSESGHYESASNDFDTVLPNLNEDPAPPLDNRARKEKSKVASEASSKVSVAEFVKDYTSTKKSLLEDNARKQQELLDAHLQEKEQRAKYLADKALYQDHKFYNKSHNHITDLRMLKWTLDKKCEIAAKYNWPWMWGDL